MLFFCFFFFDYFFGSQKTQKSLNRINLQDCPRLCASLYSFFVFVSVFQLKVNRTSSSGLKLDRRYDWTDKHKPDNKSDPMYFDVVSLAHD